MSEPWKVIGWSPARVQGIYREWGLYYTRKQKINIADLYYDKSLELDPTDTHALYFRSQCKRSIAQSEQALVDAVKALEMTPLRQPINLEVCDAIYQMNQFEDNKLNLHTLGRKFVGEKVRAFNNRVDVVDVDLENSTGDALGFFELKNAPVMLKVHEKVRLKKKIDNRPRWKILKADGKCDVQSIIETVPLRLSPREIARRLREFRVYNQYYLGRSWADVLFLRTLRKNDQLLLKQSKLTSKLLEHLTNSKYQVVLKFLKMLQCRRPLYYHIFRAFPKMKLKKEMTEAALYHVQYQTHRTITQALKSMDELRNTRQLKKLKKYVEEIMGDYIVLKTLRVMPWRLELTNKVYNLLALAEIEHLLEVPKDIRKLESIEQLRMLLKVPSEVFEKPVPFRFGNRASYMVDSDIDRTTARHRAIEARLEKRIYFSKYPIEKAALWHEMANLHLLQFRLDTCCLTADRCHDEAMKINSYVWMFLAIIMKCRAYAMIKKLKKIEHALHASHHVVHNLNSEELSRFRRLLIRVNGAALIAKRAEAIRLMNVSKLIYQNRPSLRQSQSGRSSQAGRPSRADQSHAE